MNTLEEQGILARAASPGLARASSEKKNKAINMLADMLGERLTA